jgi:hypothetical protein
MKCHINNRIRNLPDFLIVGAPKSGTTSLHFYLKEHPEVFMPEIKETLFFQIISNPNKSQLKYMKRPINTFEDYLTLFDNSQKKVAGESCPSYLYYHNYTIKNLKKYHPCWEDLKIIIILREPIDKIISHYYYLNRILHAGNESLEKILIDETRKIKENKVLLDHFLVDNTRYYQQVKAYLDNFRNVKVCLYDDLKKDPNGFIKEIFTFLNVDNTFIPTKINGAYNKGNRRNRNIFSKVLTKLTQAMILKPVIRKLPFEFKNKLRNYFYHRNEIKRKTRKRLKKIFKPEVEQLGQLINRDLLTIWKYN